MIQSFDFVLLVQNNPQDKEKVLSALLSRTPTEMIIGKTKLSFDPERRFVTVEQASADDGSACKIVKCKIPYDLLNKMLSGDYEDVTGIAFI